MIMRAEQLIDQVVEAKRVQKKFSGYRDRKSEPADPEYHRKKGETMDDYIERLKKLDAKDKKKGK